MNVVGIITSGAVALFITALLTAGIRRAVLRRGAVARPDGRPPRVRTAYLGGPAAVLSVTAVTWAGTGLGLAEPGTSVLPLLAASGALAAVGLVHDLRPLGNWPRLAAQTAAAVAVVSFSGLSPAAGVLGMVWIVFLTNAFSMLDNSDGAMGTVCAVTAAGLLVCAAADGRSGVVLLLAALMAALIALLVQGRHPARLLPGACGSQFTGFVLAGCAVLVHASAPPERAAWTALPVLTLVAVTDTVLVLVSRRRAYRPMLPDGTDHIAHRLRRVRLTKPGVAVVLGLGAVAATLTATLVYTGQLPPWAGLLPTACALLAVVALLRIPAYANGLPRPPRTPRPAKVPPAPASAAAVPGARPTTPPATGGRPAAELAGDRR
ncbi:undecaprenyl/decaprenyl-phosphate alpha-N-acetylglucosaminyl 1-phosphate transferase [Streptomyces sp. NPDC001787]|uniref:undecaprenyl/decaprenyl-phosphate alpha-N-acetylglucosaminyl 1-phosphate transferase n=1 Tax=Streptomyces sp. NPDC001787 TaxID=3154523 RepID=UPI00331BD1B1